MDRQYHEDGSLPKNDELWVFGSNIQGIHGAGSARVARFKFDAQLRVGEGITGKSYAIPTRTYNRSSGLFKTLSITEIKEKVDTFCEYTIRNQHLRWWVTAVGCGRAGYNSRQMAPLFRKAMNCSFPIEWKELLESDISSNY